MILVDTSVWIDFFRGRSYATELAALLEDDLVLIHPWVLGELALGKLGPKRLAILNDLGHLPTAPVLTDREILRLVSARHLSGSGIGFVDAQLLGSALNAKASLWTLDRQLAKSARRVGAKRYP